MSDIPEDVRKIVSDKFETSGLHFEEESDYEFSLNLMCELLLADRASRDTEGMAKARSLDGLDSYEIVQIYEAMPKPSEELIAAGAHILSEILDDSAPLHERRYLFPAEKMLQFAAAFAAYTGGGE